MPGKEALQGRPYDRDAYWHLTDEEEDELTYRCRTESEAEDARHELRLARFSALYPAIDCWVYKVATMELILGGVRRALVVVRDATITYFEAQGNIEAEAVYLCSENPYDLAESRLGISKVSEFRDLSLDTDDFMDAQARAPGRNGKSSASARSSTMRTGRSSSICVTP